MYTAEMLESIKKVEATRDARLAKVMAGENPRRMTAEETKFRDQVSRDLWHPKTGILHSSAGIFDITHVFVL